MSPGAVRSGSASFVAKSYKSMATYPRRALAGTRPQRGGAANRPLVAVAIQYILDVSPPIRTRKPGHVLIATSFRACAFL